MAGKVRLWPSEKNIFGISPVEIFKIFLSPNFSLIKKLNRGSILLMVKLNGYQKRQILISFSIQTLSHTLINNLNCRSLAK
jgi:hypothetical protein